MTDTDICADLQANGYSQPKISQLLRAKCEELLQDDGRENEAQPDCENIGGLVFAQDAEERVNARMEPQAAHDTDLTENRAAMLGTSGPKPCAGQLTHGAGYGFQEAFLELSSSPDRGSAISAPFTRPFPHLASRRAT